MKGRKNFGRRKPVFLDGPLRYKAEQALNTALAKCTKYSEREAVYPFRYHVSTAWDHKPSQLQRHRVQTVRYIEFSDPKSAPVMVTNRIHHKAVRQYE